MHTTKYWQPGRLTRFTDWLDAQTAYRPYLRPVRQVVRLLDWWGRR